MTSKENETLAIFSGIYAAKINDYLAQKFPGLSLKDPVLVLVKLMASKNPTSLARALSLSDSTDTSLPKNFKPFFNQSEHTATSDTVKKESIIDILLNPDNRKESEKNATKLFEYYKSVFGQMDKSISLASLFEVLWYSTLPCFDLKATTSMKVC